MHGMNMGIFLRILSVPHNTIIDLNYVMESTQEVKSDIL